MYLFSAATPIMLEKGTITDIIAHRPAKLKWTLLNCNTSPVFSFIGDNLRVVTKGLSTGQDTTWQGFNINDPNAQKPNLGRHHI